MGESSEYFEGNSFFGPAYRIFPRTLWLDALGVAQTRVPFSIGFPRPGMRRSASTRTSEADVVFELAISTDGAATMGFRVMFNRSQ